MGRFKRACLTWLVVGLVPVPLYAQLHVGIQGGVSLAHQKIDADTGPEEVSTRAGFVAGLTLAYRIDSHVQLALGGRIAQKGATQAQPGGVDALLRSTYAEVPVSVQLFPSEGTRVRPFLSVGGFLAFETGCDLRLEGGGQVIDVGCEEAADRKKTDLGLLVGAGSEIDLRALALTLEAAYSVGLRDISHTPFASVKTRTIFLTAGLSYALSKGGGGA